MSDIPRVSAADSWTIRLIRSPAAFAVILLLGVALYWPGLRSLPAVDRDEARFAQSSRQMRESGDIIDIRLQDEARLKKPVGIYWLQAAATAIAGEDPANPIWTYRLPSFIGALAAILITLAIGRRWFSPEAGFAGAALLAACLLLGFEARQAKTDAFLLSTVLAAMAGLAEAWVPVDAETPLPRSRWIIFWAAIGIGILIKGPIIVMVVGLAAAVLCGIDRRLAWLKRLKPWPGIAITAAITLPWLIAITVASHGAFWSQSLGNDMAAKLTGGQESHGAPPGTYLTLFPVTFWPGSLFALLALPWIWRARHERTVQFALAWIVPSWIVLEIVPTKLPHYVLPLYPAIALLTGAALMQAPPGAVGWRSMVSRAAILLWIAIGGVLGAIVLATAPLGDGRLSIRGIAAALALWGLTAAGGWTMWRGRRFGAAAISVLGAIVAWGLVFGAALPALGAPWIAPRLKEALFEKLPTGHGTVLIAGYAEPSAVIALGTDTRFGSGGDAARLLASDPNAVAIVSREQGSAFNAGLADGHVNVETLGTVDGFNYAKGHRVTLTIWRRVP